MLSIFIQHVHILGGNPPDSQQHLWLLVDLPLWKMMEFVSWENMGKYIPDIYEKKMFQTTKQISMLEKPLVAPWLRIWIPQNHSSAP